MCSKQANGRSPAADVANPSGGLKGEACALSFGANIAAAQTLSIHSATVCLHQLPALTSDADQVQGTDPGSGWRLPYQNEPVAEPPPLAPEMLQPYLRRLLHLLQPGETVTAGLRQVSSQRRWALCCALSLVEWMRQVADKRSLRCRTGTDGPEGPVALLCRRLAGAGPVLDKFGNKEQARRFFQERVRSGHAGKLPEKTCSWDSSTWAVYRGLARHMRGGGGCPFASLLTLPLHCCCAARCLCCSSSRQQCCVPGADR